MTLRAENLGVCVEGKWLVRGIDLDVAAGQLLSVVGPNGAGKTTLLRALASEIEPSEGAATLEGKPLSEWGGPERGRRVGVLPQHSSPAFGFTALEMAVLGRLPHQGRTWRNTNGHGRRDGWDEDRRIEGECLRQTGTLHLAERSWTTLSGGERQRVQLARVLAQVHSGEDGFGGLAHGGDSVGRRCVANTG
jgi:iron complex transport system ATP-binding protein